MSTPTLSAADTASRWHPGLLAALLRCDRLTVVYSPAGAERDAMLRRVLLPLLARRSTDRSPGRPPSTDEPAPAPLTERRRERRGSETVLCFDAWGPAPLRALREQIAAELPLAPAGPRATLADHLRAVAREHGTRLLLVFDGFERHLAQPADTTDDLRRFDEQFVDWMRRTDDPAHALLVVDDASQPLLQQRYGTALPQIGRGWLRIRPSGLAVPEATAEHLAPMSPARPATSPHATPARGRDFTAQPARADDFAPASPTHTQPLPAALAEYFTPAPPVEDFAPAPPAALARGHRADDLATIAPGRETVPGAAGDLANRPTAVLPHPLLAAEPDELAEPARRRLWPRRLADAALAAAAAALLTWWLMPGPEPVPRAPAAVAGAASGVAAAAPEPGVASAAAPPPVARPAPAPAAAAPPPAEAPRPAAATPPLVEAPRPAAATPPPVDAPRPAAATPPAADAPRPMAAALPRWRLGVALPPDSGTARTLIDELAERVAAPAGITLTAAPAGAAAPLAVWRHDALVAARQSGERRALRVLAPLYREQVQVVVRAGSRWRLLHQLQGLHLNVGEAGGARDRTASALYRALYGRALPSWDIDRRDEASALRELAREGSALDAVLVVSDTPVLEQLPAAVRSQLRVLVLDPQTHALRELQRSFSLLPPRPGEAPVLMATSYLVTPGTASADDGAALQALACALRRAQPALQRQGSPLLRGIDLRQPLPATGWPALLSPADEAAADCAPPTAGAAASGPAGNGR